jgi:hypothetical protein
MNPNLYGPGAPLALELNTTIFSSSFVKGAVSLFLPVILLIKLSVQKSLSTLACLLPKVPNNC